MARKSLGYVHLEWECPACNTRNPGPEPICRSCGAAQPEDVEFVQAAEETLITDEETLKRAKAAPDVHCAYCGTRNPAAATTCSNCMADLSEGTTRSSGRVLGAHRQEKAADIVCPFCSTVNEGTALRCKNCDGNLQQPEADAAPAQPKPKSQPKRERANPILYVVGGILLLAICGFIALSFRTEETVGTVTDLSWERTIVVESLQPVAYEDWLEDLPAAAEVGICSDQYHHTQNSPTENSREVCGTPYTVDDGSGFGEVVQDCRYEVFEPWCEYTVEEWVEADTLVTDGSDYNPIWPEAQLLTDERLGARDETYRVQFNSDGRSYTYVTSSFDRYLEFEIGSEWVLEVNSFNAVVSASPAN